MRIYVRNYNNGTVEYVWKNISHTNPFFGKSEYRTEDGERYSFFDIFKISADYRKSGKYVICGNCGAVIKRNATNKHFETQERNADCMKCSDLRLEKIENTQRNKMCADGNVFTTVLMKPYCGIHYYYENYPLDNFDKTRVCKYFACRRKDVKEMRQDVLFTFQNPYNNILTEAGVIRKKWNFVNTSNGTSVYSNRNGKVLAIFDLNGILIKFRLFKRDTPYDFMYSDVYDEFICENGVFRWAYLAESTIEKYKKQIRSLYKING